MPCRASLRAETFIAIAAEVAASFCSHGYLPIFAKVTATTAPLNVVLIRLPESDHRSAAFTYFELLEDVVREQLDDPSSTTGHACALQTSLALFLWPELVDPQPSRPGDSAYLARSPHLVTSKASSSGASMRSTSSE